MKLLSYSSRLQVRFSEERGLFFDEEERQNAPEAPLLREEEGGLFDGALSGCVACSCLPFSLPFLSTVQLPTKNFSNNCSFSDLVRTFALTFM